MDLRCDLGGGSGSLTVAVSKMFSAPQGASALADVWWVAPSRLQSQGAEGMKGEGGEASDGGGWGPGQALADGLNDPGTFSHVWVTFGISVTSPLVWLKIMLTQVGATKRPWSEVLKLPGKEFRAKYIDSCQNGGRKRNIPLGKMSPFFIEKAVASLSKSIAEIISVLSKMIRKQIRVPSLLRALAR